MNEPRFVQAALPRFQGKVDRFALIYQFGTNLRPKDVLGGIYRLIFRETVVVSAGNHAHAAVFRSGFIYGEPNSADAGHGGDTAVPVGRILMPRGGFARVGRFADKVAAPKSNVRPHNRLDEV